ncbi:hypothetical protein [Xenorhabdus bovienii]|uniref:hypothetical protein n=1 Tax=Xenorhabdus bovienii TaxID=40576 RepID=UPI0023B215D0|nr:hypothetical protein [Xenorhabdus bovienii]
MATWTHTDFAAAGSVNPNGKNWVSGNSTALAGISVKRKAPVIQCAIKLAGAVHFADVIINVNR